MIAVEACHVRLVELASTDRLFPAPTSPNPGRNIDYELLDKPQLIAAAGVKTQ
jgi:hypothetical protein